MRVFIGWDSRFPEPARVLAHSLKRHSTIPIDVTYLHKEYLYQTHGFARQVEDPLASTEFTYSRFLVPYLCGYRGHALFLDNDMVNYADLVQLAEFAEIRMLTKAIAVVQHDYQPTQTTKMYGCPQTSYPRKNWSSCMLFNCRRLKCWTRELVAKAPGSRLHRFMDIPDDQITELDPSWNRLDELVGTPGRETKILHWTSGGPWNDSTRTWPHEELWFAARQDWYDAGCP